MNEDILSRLDAIESRLGAIEVILSKGAPIVASGAAPLATVSLEQRPLSITEYVIQKGPIDDNQRTLVLADYLETQRGQESFTSDELRQAFIDSRLRVPSNVSDKISKCAKKGYLMPYGEREGKKAWRLTMTGQSIIKEGFR